MSFITKISLSNFNKYAFFLHFISAVAITIVFFVKKGDINFNTDLYSYKITDIEGERNEKITFSFGEEGDPKIEVKSVALKIIVILIFAITALFHLLYWRSDFYKKEIEKGYNRYRWLEYSITATLMIFIICIISGLKEYNTVFLICILNISLMSLGYFLERSPYLEVKIVCLVLGFFLLISIFSFIYYSLITNLKRTNDIGYDVPDWIQVVLIPMVLWWISFGVVAILQTVNMNKKNYTFVTYEKWYIFLSYVSKAFMGYYLVFGLTRDKADKKNASLTF